MRRWGLALLVLALAGCGGGGDGGDGGGEASAGTLSWPAPAGPIGRTRLADLTPETHEFVNYHVHAHLDVFVNGRTVSVPAAIGIDTRDPAVRRFEQNGVVGYGGISPPCDKPCISPLHTHFPDGVLHTEAKKNRPNTLGEFFVEWNVRLDKDCVARYCRPTTPIAVYVDGDEYDGDPRGIELEDQREIAIVIGTPPDDIPNSFPGG
jgi:hypothetical protein